MTRMDPDDAQVRVLRPVPPVPLPPPVRLATDLLPTRPERPIPANVEAEEAVLGSILIDPEALTVALGLLHPADFYRDAHRTLFAAMRALHLQGAPVDLVVLVDALERVGQLDAIGGASAVSMLANRVPTSANVAHYCQIVRRTALARRLIQAGADIVQAAYAQTEDAEGLFAYASALVADARGEGTLAAAPYHLASVAEILAQPRPEPLIRGYYTLDTTGILYAKPGIGKSVLLLDQMAHVALGRAWEGHAVRAGHVVYVCAEGQAFLGERLEALLKKLGVEEIPRLHLLPARIQLLEPHAVAHLLSTFAVELPERPLWIAFDTVSQTSGGADENAATDMRDYLHALDRLRQETGAFVQAIHHTGKDESRGARGSSVFLANCDTVLAISQRESAEEGEGEGATAGGVCVLRNQKQRGGARPIAPFAFRVEALPLDGEGEGEGEDVRTGPVLRACGGRAAGRGGQTFETRAMAWLREYLADGEPHTSAEVTAAAAAAGIAARPLRVARERLGVVPRRRGSRETTQSYWELPDDGEAGEGAAPAEDDADA